VPGDGRRAASTRRVAALRFADGRRTADAERLAAGFIERVEPIADAAIAVVGVFEPRSRHVDRELAHAAGKLLGLDDAVLQLEHRLLTRLVGQLRRLDELGVDGNRLVVQVIGQ
jgi:hypothetical protein